MSGEGGPCARDPVLHLGGFLVHECDLYFSFGREYLDMHLVDVDFSQLVFSGL